MYQSLHRLAEVSGKCSLFINKKLFFLSCLCAGLMAVPTTIDVIGSLLFHKALTCSTELVEFFRWWFSSVGWAMCTISAPTSMWK